MLKGIPDIIGSDLLKALADTGHGDLIVIADHFYPALTKTPHGAVIQAKGVGSAQMLDALLKLVPLDAEYCEHPVEYMIPDADSGVALEENRVWEDTISVTVCNGFAAECVGGLERSKFYEKAKNACLTVSTSERQPYGCIIIQKGVL